MNNLCFKNFVCEFSCLDLCLASYNPDWSSVNSSTMWILDEAKLLRRIDAASTSFLVQVFKILTFTSMVLFYSVETSYHTFLWSLLWIESSTWYRLDPIQRNQLEVKLHLMQATWHMIVLWWISKQLMHLWRGSQGHQQLSLIGSQNRKEFFLKKKRKERTGHLE
jgi:hypothetical protein